jgi:hypothetical protein
VYDEILSNLLTGLTLDATGVSNNVHTTVNPDSLMAEKPIAGPSGSNQEDDDTFMQDYGSNDNFEEPGPEGLRM